MLASGPEALSQSGPWLRRCLVFGAQASAIVSLPALTTFSGKAQPLP